MKFFCLHEIWVGLFKLTLMWRVRIHKGAESGMFSLWGPFICVAQLLQVCLNFSLAKMSQMLRGLSLFGLNIAVTEKAQAKIPCSVETAQKGLRC